MSRRLLYTVALVVLLGGLALALFVVPARTCRMDDFDCFDSHNFPKALVAAGAIVAAFVVAILALFRGEAGRGERGSRRKATPPSGTLPLLGSGVVAGGSSPPSSRRGLQVVSGLLAVARRTTRTSRFAAPVGCRSADMHPNERLLRDEYRARAARDDTSLAEAFTEDVMWHVPGRSAISGEYRGREQVMAYVRRRRDLADGTFAIVVEDVLANDEHGLVIARGSAIRHGKNHQWRAHGLYSFRDGRIAECWVLPEDQDAFDRIWS